MRNTMIAAAASLALAAAITPMSTPVFAHGAGFAGGHFAGFNGGRHFGDFGGRFDHGRFGRFGGFRRGFGFGGPFGYGGSYGYYGYGYDSCYVFTPSGYVWACY